MSLCVVVMAHEHATYYISLVVTPYYLKTTQKGLVKHFTHIADAADLPMILYNVPGRTGSDLKPETVAQVAPHKNIIGKK